MSVCGLKVTFTKVRHHQRRCPLGAVGQTVRLDELDVLARGDRLLEITRDVDARALAIETIWSSERPGELSCGWFWNIASMNA
jgi:hypothetical protein